MEETTSVEVEYEEIANRLRAERDRRHGALFPGRLAALSPRLRVALTVALITCRQCGCRLRCAKAASKPPAIHRSQLPQLPGKHSVAVMYFDNQSVSADLEWLREGLADMLITNLSRSKRLNVLSRQQLHLLLERLGHRQRRCHRLDEALETAQISRAEIVALGSFARLGENIRINTQFYIAQTVNRWHLKVWSSTTREIFSPTLICCH